MNVAQEREKSGGINGWSGHADKSKRKKTRINISIKKNFNNTNIILYGTLINK